MPVFEIDEVVRMSRQIKALMRSPAAMARFQATGRLPQSVKRPRTPLFVALDAIGPRCRQAIKGLTVDHRLGYSGRRVFHTADQAFRWLGGYEPERFDCQPRLASESWIDWRFTRPVTWEMLRECVSGPVPAGVERHVSQVLPGQG
jgi:hypothetical protein